MKRRNRIFSIFAVLLMVFTVVSCSGVSNPDASAKQFMEAINEKSAEKITPLLKKTNAEAVKKVLDGEKFKTLVKDLKDEEKNVLKFVITSASLADNISEEDINKLLNMYTPENIKEVIALTNSGKSKIDKVVNVNTEGDKAKIELESTSDIGGNVSKANFFLHLIKENGKWVIDKFEEKK